VRKWEAEWEERKAEQKERDRKWEAEREDRKAELRLKEVELGLKKDEAAKQDTSVGKSNVISDTMRSSVIRMSDDPHEAVAFFMSVEQLLMCIKCPLI